MPVDILEVQGRTRHPAVNDRTSRGHAAFAEDGFSLLEIRLADREGKVITGKLAGVLLKDDHARGATRSKE